jgi:hypothetical protein
MAKIVSLASMTQDKVVLVLNAVRKADRFAKEIEADLQAQFSIKSPETEKQGLHPATLQFVGSICDLDILEYLRLQSLMEVFNFVSEARAAGHEIPEWAQAWDG